MQQHHCVPLTALLFQGLGDQILLIISERDYHIDDLKKRSIDFNICGLSTTSRTAGFVSNTSNRMYTEVLIRIFIQKFSCRQNDIVKGDQGKMSYYYF